MQNLLQRDLGSSLLSIAVILGWLGLFFVFAIVLEIINIFKTEEIYRIKRSLSVPTKDPFAC